MATVQELLPGDLVNRRGENSVFIASGLHPGLDPLLMVIWKADDGEWALGVMSPDDEAGDVHPSSSGLRWERIMEAFRGR